VTIRIPLAVGQCRICNSHFEFKANNLTTKRDVWAEWFDKDEEKRVQVQRVALDLTFERRLSRRSVSASMRGTSTSAFSVYTDGAMGDVKDTSANRDLCPPRAKRRRVSAISNFTVGDDSVFGGGDGDEAQEQENDEGDMMNNMQEDDDTPSDATTNTGDDDVF